MMNRFYSSSRSDWPQRPLVCAIAIGLMSGGGWASIGRPGVALPQSPRVQSGQVNVQQKGPRLDIIQTTPNASINWKQFSIGANESVNFRQPSRQSVILNRVTGVVRSDIAGTLKANGTVLLLNPNGILFSHTSKVDVGAILATTLSLRERDFQAGNYQFHQSSKSPLSIIENFGSISVKDDGFAALVAPAVRNRGVIQAQLGQVILGSGTALTLDFYQDGLLSFEIDSTAQGTISQGTILDSDGQPITSLIEQAGSIQSDGGSVFLTAQSGADVLENLINLEGVTRAQTVANRNGKIVLSGGSSQPTLVSGVLDVSGTDGAESAGKISIEGAQLVFESASLQANGVNGGGHIQVSADQQVSVDADSQFSANAAQGDAGAIAILSNGVTQVSGNLSATALGDMGQGGQIETSGKQLAIAASTSVNVSSSSGNSGTWTLDPDQLFVAETGDNALPGPDTGNYTVAASAVVEALISGDVDLQANDLIQIDAPINTTNFESFGDQTLSLLDQDENGDLTVNLNAPITLGFGQQLKGDATTVNVGIGADGLAQNAIDVAAANAIVNLSAGTFKRSLFEFNSVINIDKDLTITGQGPDQTVLDGLSENFSSRVVNVLPGVTATIEDLTIANGNALGSNGGGALVGADANLELSNVSVENSTAAVGGGIYSQGTLSITDSTVNGNEAVGSPFDTPIDSPGFDDDIFPDSVLQGIGGGIFGAVESEITVLESVISSNSAESAGGGIATLGSANVEQSEIENNTAERGGGLYSQGTINLINSTISGNEAGVSGGGIALESGSATLTHVTVAQNQVVNPEFSTVGGGIASNNSTLTLNSSLVSGNEADSDVELSQDSDTIFNSNGHNFVGKNGDRGGFPESENVFETAFAQNLAPLANYGGSTDSHALLPGSVAIDAAPNLIETDQRDISRPQGSSSDAGAFESQGFSVFFEEGSGQSTVVNTDFPEPLLFQVSANDSLEPVEGGVLSVQAPSEGAGLTESAFDLDIDSAGFAQNTITANTIAGSYEAIASFGTEDVTVSLENLPDVPALITASGGTFQQTPINTEFNPLQASVTDQFGNEISDIPVSFEAPATGPSANFITPSSTMTNALGIASVELVANDEVSPFETDGDEPVPEPYVVFANSGDLTPAQFFLANLEASTPPVTPPPVTPPPVTPPPVTSPPVDPPSIDPSPVDPPPSPELDPGEPVDKVDQELKQTFNPNNPPQPIRETGLRPTPAIALTPRIDEQLVRLETVFTQQYQQFLGADAVEVLRPQDVSVQLKRAKAKGDFTPAVIYAFFTPKGTVAQQARINKSGWLASLEQGHLLTQVDAATLEENCLVNQKFQADDPLWQFDTCGWNNIAPSTRPSQESDQLVLLLVTSEGRAIRQVVPDANRAKVLETVKVFQRSVTDLSLPVGQSKKVGQQVYDWIVTPLQDELQAEGIDNLVFIMDEGLRSMPLAAMHDGTGYLIENYSVGLMPSMSLAETDFVSVRDMQVLAMGADEFQSQSPLPSVPVEISTIAQDIWQGEAFLNESFTPQTLRNARESEQYGIVHLATHGEFRAGDRDRSYIQFWDQKVRIDELSDLGLTSSPPVSLLVLSACRTALGDPNAELGFTGLAVSSGVQTAMGGLWYVSDVGTLGLMTSFYNSLRTAPIKAEALRQAQLSLMSGATRIENTQVITPELAIPLPQDLQQISSLDLSHPYYWSGITMIGTPW